MDDFRLFEMASEDIPVLTLIEGLKNGLRAYSG